MVVGNIKNIAETALPMEVMKLLRYKNLGLNTAVDQNLIVLFFFLFDAQFYLFLNYTTVKM